MKKQEAKEILSSQGLKRKLSKIPLLDTIFFFNAVPLKIVK